MKKLKKGDIKQEVFDLYDDYAHNKLNRRQFVEKLSLYAVGGITVSSLLSFISPNYIDNFLSYELYDAQLQRYHAGTN